MRLLVGIIIVISTFQNAFGQTKKYWSLNFASESSILAGSVVGGFAENQAIYYNPAIISESKTDNIGLSGEIIALDFYRAKNAFGNGFHLKNSRLNVVPSYVSFFLKSKKKPNLSFQVAILTRDKNDFDISTSMVGQADIYEEIPGDEKYSVMYETVLRYSDIWLGAGMAYSLGERFSIGVSTFFSIKKLNDKLTKSINIIPSPESVITITGDSSYFYSNAREINRTKLTNYKLQAKIGVQYKLPRWSFGLNVSVPSLLIAGKAYRYREVGFSQIYWETDKGFLPDFILVDSQDDLPAVYKDPLSVAIGLNYCPQQDKDMLGVSIEYFKQIPVYKMVDAEGSIENLSPIPDQNSSNLDFLSIYYGATNILNLSVGYRKYINAKLTLLGGFRTDFDYLKNLDLSETSNAYNNFIKFSWDVFHVTAGARFNVGRHRFIVGAQYSTGNEKNSRQLADFSPNLSSDNLDLPIENLDESNVSFRYDGIALFFGFIFNFQDKAEIK